MQQVSWINITNSSQSEFREPEQLSTRYRDKERGQEGGGAGGNGGGGGGWGDEEERRGEERRGEKEIAEGGRHSGRQGDSDRDNRNDCAGSQENLDCRIWLL